MLASQQITAVPGLPLVSRLACDQLCGKQDTLPKNPKYLVQNLNNLITFNTPFCKEGLGLLGSVHSHICNSFVMAFTLGYGHGYAAPFGSQAHPTENSRKNRAFFGRPIIS